MKSERAGLLTLPRELRDKIYDYLLGIDRWDTLIYNMESLSKPGLSVLRVNRTLHGEASDTLYGKNNLVCMTIEPRLLQNFCDTRFAFGCHKGFPGDRPVPWATYARTVSVAAATVTLQRLPQFAPGSDRVPLLVSSFAMPHLCRILTAYAKVNELEIHLSLNFLNTGKAKGDWYESWLDCFKEARGLGSATISDANGNTSHAELATLMMSSFEKSQEIIDRASMYQNRALQKQRLGLFSGARWNYHECRMFIKWFFSSGLELIENVRNDKKTYESLGRKMTETGFSCAFLSIKLGDLSWAAIDIDWTMTIKRYQGKEADETEAWFLYGLRDVAIGAGNGAAYCFLQTLWKQPGHPGADEAVDEMEARLQPCTGLAERIILHNIQHVLKPFRHQTQGSTVMSTDGYKLLFQKWYIGRKETDSVGYRHCSRGSVILGKRNRYG